MPLKLSKTEALILSRALERAKFDYCDVAAGTSKIARLQFMRKINDLQTRLEKHSDDERMYGRRRMWDFGDRMRWWVFGKPEYYKLPQDPEPKSEVIIQPNLFEL
jgi:hypothetical protein